jgi:pimeloyl-ACP methyl ester carboxylesterase
MSAMRELTLPAPVVLLPGLGADARLFQPQRDALGPAVKVPSWIKPASRGESLGAYAERWAVEVNAMVAGFSDDRPWFLGGASMGGMLALEMVPHLERLPAALLLIASSRSDPDYDWFTRIGATVLQRMPASVAGMMLRYNAIPMAVRDGLDDRGIRTLFAMAGDADSERFCWAMGAAVEWTYPGPPETVNGQPFPPIHQIHGGRDWLIHLIEEDVETVVERGRHVLTFSHAKTVNRWIYDHVLRYCGIDESDEPRVQDPDATVSRRPEFAARY